MQNMDWYHALNKPWGTPPDWVFGVVWPVLYLMMGAAMFFAWRYSEGRKRAYAAGLFVVQLVLNLMWSPLFFGMQNVSGALWLISVLWLVLLATIMLFFKISKTAGWLMVPYGLWVSYAVYLNAGVVWLN